MSSPSDSEISELVRKVLAQDLPSLTPQDFERKGPLERLLLVARIMVTDPAYLRVLACLEFGRQRAFVKAAGHYLLRSTSMGKDGAILEAAMDHLDKMIKNEATQVTQDPSRAALCPESQRESSARNMHRFNKARAESARGQGKFLRLEADFRFGAEAVVLSQIAEAVGALANNLANEVAKRGEVGLPIGDLLIDGGKATPEGRIAVSWPPLCRAGRTHAVNGEDSLKLRAVGPPNYAKSALNKFVTTLPPAGGT